MDPKYPQYPHKICAPPPILNARIGFLRRLSLRKMRMRHRLTCDPGDGDCAAVQTKTMNDLQRENAILLEEVRQLRAAVSIYREVVRQVSLTSRKA